MIDKLKELLGSRRFWLLVAGAVSFILARWSQETLTPDVVFEVLGTLFAAIAGVGTIDKAWTSIK
jgi:hypothetical protein